MTIPMPRQLRVFDHVEDQYKIWAVVRYIKTAIVENKTVLRWSRVHREASPASYETEPSKRYDITEHLVPGDKIRRRDTDTFCRSARLYRHNIAVDMRIEIVDDAGNVIEQEQTVTENISTKGATLFTTLRKSRTAVLFV
jgi:hypothetical protein